EEDCIMLSDATPKAFIRGHGNRCVKGDKPIDENPPERPRKGDLAKPEDYSSALKQYAENFKQWKKDMQESYVLIDMNYKTIVFLDSPRPETLSMLKTLMSHDKKRQTYQFVDKTPNGPSKTYTVFIDGWPSIVYLDTDQWYMTEISTRCFSVTPSSDPEKIKAAKKLETDKNSFPWEHNTERTETTLLKLLLRSIRGDAEKYKLSVIIPFPNLDEVFPSTVVRDMRDYTHFGQ
ncbi:MAG: hypothetical protein WC325_12790, partial [Candidatus Bathyarchaeia archaeon]